MNSTANTPNSGTSEGEIEPSALRRVIYVDTTRALLVLAEHTISELQRLRPQMSELLFSYCTGGVLTKLRPLCPGGHWEDWLCTLSSYSPQDARRFMQKYRELKESKLDKHFNSDGEPVEVYYRFVQTVVHLERVAKSHVSMSDLTADPNVMRQV